MKSKIKNCQSCGMPIKKEIDLGTEKNGEKNKIYCKHCYQYGEFTEPNLTVEQIQKRVFDQLKKFHFPNFLAKAFIKKIPFYQRWNKK